MVYCTLTTFNLHCYWYFRVTIIPRIKRLASQRQGISFHCYPRSYIKWILFFEGSSSLETSGEGPNRMFFGQKVYSITSDALLLNCILYEPALFYTSIVACLNSTNTDLNFVVPTVPPIASLVCQHCYTTDMPRLWSLRCSAANWNS